MTFNSTSIQYVINIKNSYLNIKNISAFIKVEILILYQYNLIPIKQNDFNTGK